MGGVQSMKRLASATFAMVALCALIIYMVFAADAAYAQEDASARADTVLTTASAQAASDAQGTSLVTSASSSKKTGWEKTKAGWVYYRKGAKVLGLQKINGVRYFFNAKGIMKASDFKTGNVTFYVRDDGAVLGAKMGKKFYYDTLKPMTSGDAYDFETFLWARSIVKSISKASDSKETKLRKAYDWVISQPYGLQHVNFNPYAANWPALYARDHFSESGGDCHADGAAFAYLAAAIGYDADVCIDSWASGYASSHCWTMIGPKVYDPLFSEAKDYWGFYGVTSGTYQTSPTARFRVPEYSSANNKSGKVPASLQRAATVGLSKSSGKMYWYESGKKVKNAWRTINGKRYYFKKNGVAATGPAKIKGVYYVFNKSGVLQDGTKSGLRIVKVAGVKYRVNKAGKAAPGWSTNKKNYYATNGSQVKSAWKTIGGKRYYFNSAGTKATYSASVKGVYYVFDKDGVLLKSSIGGNREVVVGGRTYQVNAKGAAVAGWNADKTKMFDESGLMYAGVHFVEGGLYAFDGATGIYQPEETAALQAAGKVGEPVLPLLKLLGKPVSEPIYARACIPTPHGDGDMGYWEYDHIIVTTELPPGAAQTTEKDLEPAEGDQADGSDGASGESSDAPVELIYEVREK